MSDTISFSGAETSVLFTTQAGNVKVTDVPIGAINIYRLNFNSQNIQDFLGPLRKDLETPDIDSEQLTSGLASQLSSSTPTPPFLEEVLDSIIQQINPLYWTNSVDLTGYKAQFSKTISEYKINVTNLIKNTALLQVGPINITSAFEELSGFRRILNGFENTVALKFNRLKLEPLLTSAGLEPVLKPNDIMEIFINRGGGPERVFLGFLTPISTEEKESTTKYVRVTCYGLSKVLGLTRVVSTPALFSQFEDGTLEIDDHNFTAFENIFSGMSIEDIFRYIMENALALKSTVSTSNTDDASRQVADKLESLSSSKREISRLKNIQKTLVLEHKNLLPSIYVDSTLDQISSVRTGAIKGVEDTFNTAVNQASHLSESKRNEALQKADTDKELSTAQINLFSYKANAKPKSNEPILDKILSSTAEFQKIIQAITPEITADLAAHFLPDGVTTENIQFQLQQYLQYESQIRINELDTLQKIKTLGRVDSAILRSIKISYEFDPEVFKNPASFRTAFQLLYLYHLIRAQDVDSTVAILDGGGDLRAYNTSFRHGFEAYYSQLEYAEGPLKVLRDTAFYDVFENEKNQIVCRPPKYNKFDYSNDTEFTITQDRIITKSTVKDDLTLETRIDYMWYLPPSGDLPFHGGHFTDIGILTTYGMRAQAPKSNPNARSVELATLFSAMDLARRNSQTRTITLTVINDREYHLGELYFIPDDIEIKTGMSLSSMPGISLSLTPSRTTVGKVGYLVDYSTSFVYGGVNTHTLVLSYVRDAEVVTLADPISVSYTNKNGDSVMDDSLSTILNFKRIPDLDTILRIADKNPGIATDKMSGIQKALDLQENFEKTDLGGAEVDSATGNFVAYWDVDFGDLGFTSTSVGRRVISKLLNRNNPKVTNFSKNNFSEQASSQPKISQSLIDLLNAFNGPTKGGTPSAPNFTGGLRGHQSELLKSLDIKVIPGSSSLAKSVYKDLSLSPLNPTIPNGNATIKGSTNLSKFATQNPGVIPPLEFWTVIGLKTGTKLNLPVSNMFNVSTASILLHTGDALPGEIDSSTGIPKPGSEFVPITSVVDSSNNPIPLPLILTGPTGGATGFARRIPALIVQKGIATKLQGIDQEDYVIFSLPAFGAPGVSTTINPNKPSPIDVGVGGSMLTGQDSKILFGKTGVVVELALFGRGILSPDKNLQYIYLVPQFSIGIPNGLNAGEDIAVINLPFDISIESLMTSGSVVAGYLSPSTLHGISTVEDPYTNAHPYGAAIDFSFLPWGTQNGGWIDLTKGFVNKFESLLTALIGPVGRGGWTVNTLHPQSSGGQNIPIGSNLLRRYHFQVPFSILFPHSSSKEFTVTTVSPAKTVGG